MLLSAVSSVAGTEGLLRKVGGALSAVSQQFKDHLNRNRGSDRGFIARDDLLKVVGTRVAIEARAQDGAGATLVNELRSLAATNIVRRGDSVSALVPLRRMDRLGTFGSLRFARPEWVRTHAGDTESQGGLAAFSDFAREEHRVDGTGVKVGIVSDSFDTSTTASNDYADDIASEDLPAGIQVLQDFTGSTIDEGRAMAQIIHDSAPGATLSFATGFGGQANMAANIRALRDAGADIIVDDVIYFAAPMFQDGLVSRAIDEVVGDGVAYFSSAGNANRNSYEDSFRFGRTLAEGSIPDMLPAGVDFGGGRTHDFSPGPGVDDLLEFRLSAGEKITITFQWDEPFVLDAGDPGSASDLDIYVLNEAGTLVVGGGYTFNFEGDPVEVFEFTNTTGSTADFNLMIVNFQDPATVEGPDPTRVKFVDFARQAQWLEHFTFSGTVFGHANAAGAAAVGAANWFLTPAYGQEPPLVASYSAAGGTPVLIDTNGTRFASPVTRQKPYFVAPDGGNTTFFGQQINDGDTFPNFFGTSAAAPEAAAIAALMLQGRPTLTPAQLYNALADTAIDMDDPNTPTFDVGHDTGTGFGLIQADLVMNELFPIIEGIQINDGSAQRSKITSLTVTFDRAVDAPASAFQLVPRTAVTGVITMNVVSSLDDKTYFITFEGSAVVGGSLPDAIYDFTVDAGLIDDAIGQSPANDLAVEFHRLYSDVDGDGDSDNADLFQMRSTYGKFLGDAGFNPAFDYEDDNDVDNADVFQVRSRRAITFTNY